MDRVTVAAAPACDVAGAVFYNNLTCRGTPFTARLAIQGEILTAVSGQSSNREDVGCGKSVNWRLYADVGGYGTIEGHNRLTFTCDCLYDIELDLDEYHHPAIYLYATCSDDYFTMMSPQMGTRRLLDRVRLPKDDGGFDSLESMFR